MSVLLGRKEPELEDVGHPQPLHVANNEAARSEISTKAPFRRLQGRAHFLARQVGDSVPRSCRTEGLFFSLFVS